MHRAGLPAASAPSPRSWFVTLLAWAVIVFSALLVPISLISGMMVMAGSHGTASAGALGFFTMVLGPPITLAAGIGLLWRRKWALVTIMVVLGGIAFSNGLNLARNASAPRSYVSPGGVPTTVVPAGPDYVVPTAILVVVCAGLLVALLLPRVRREFGFGIGRSRPAAAAAGPSAAGTPVARPPPAAAATRSAMSDRERGWRVGHRGRDLMVYEEWRDGAWQRIDISGEMLIGDAHHAIYFASPQRWLEYPEWARHRRDEIMARIKSAFRPPDYTYADDQPPTGGASPASALGGQPAPAATASRPPPAGPPQRPLAVEPRRPRLNTAVGIAVTVLLAVSVATGGLVGHGLIADETFLPIKRATLQRVVVRQEEPVAFWMSLGLYSALGIGTLGAAVWLLRETVRRGPDRPL